MPPTGVAGRPGRQTRQVVNTPVVQADAHETPIRNTQAHQHVLVGGLKREIPVLVWMVLVQQG